MQPSYVIPLICVWVFYSIFGMVVEMKQMSGNDRLERKKYIGVWRWGYELTTRMMSRFSKHKDQVHGEEKPKYEGLQFWFL